VTFTHSSFVIQFPEHLPFEKQRYCLDRLSESGASVEPQSERVFRVVCRKPNELASVGWAVFHTHFAKICRVIGTSGMAEAHASAYPKASK
jgi:hypothetical protein